MSRIESKLTSLGLALPAVPSPVASYVNCVCTGNTLHLSGGLPSDDGNLITGKIPTDLGIEAAAYAAKLTILNRLAVIKAEIGNLDLITRIISISGFVNCEPDFHDHPKVINGASDLLVEIFGDIGMHSRVALGVSSLPFNVVVEIAMIVEIETC